MVSLDRRRCFGAKSSILFVIYGLRSIHICMCAASLTCDHRPFLSHFIACSEWDLRLWEAFSVHILGCAARVREFRYGGPAFTCSFWPWVLVCLLCWLSGLCLGGLLVAIFLSPGFRRFLGHGAQLVAWTLVPPVPPRDAPRAHARLREYRGQ